MSKTLASAIPSCFPAVGTVVVQPVQPALELPVSSTRGKTQVGHCRPGFGSCFSSPGLLQEKWRCYAEQVILCFRGVRWETQKLHPLCFFKKLSHKSACNFIANNFSPCIYFQEFVTVSLNSADKTGSCNLTGLWDSTEYSVAIRCISDVSIFWSEWSTVKTASTEEKGRLTIY